MKLIVVTGMPAAGKNIAARYAQKHEYPLFSTGDFVRAEIRKRGLSGNPEMSAKVSTRLRGKDGLGVTHGGCRGLENKNRGGFSGMDSLSGGLYDCGRCRTPADTLETS